MKAMLAFSKAIDALNQKFGLLAEWCVVLACFISAGNAAVRYIFHSSSNGLLEIQWYLFSAVFLLGAAETLRHNEHVRVDIFYASISPRGRLLVDLSGTILFLLPVCALLAWMSWPFFQQSYDISETSQNAGGLLRWPVKILIPLGFGLLFLQGLSEIIKRIAALKGVIMLDTKYEKPLQ